MTIALASERARSFSEIFAEPLRYAEDMLLSAFRVQNVAVSTLLERRDFCAALIDLTSRTFQAIAGIILIMPIVNIVALQIFRFFNISAFAPLNTQEVIIPEEILNLGVLTAEEIAFDAEFGLMGNRGEVLVPEDPLHLSEASAEESQQRKEALIQALTHPESPLELENFRVSDEVATFNLDAILARYRTDHPHRSLELFFEYANVPSHTRLRIHECFEVYIASGLRRQDRDAVESFSRLYDFLVQKKALFQNHPKEDLFKAEIRSIFDKICDAHNNCIDQVRSQLETIVIETIAAYDAMREGSSQNRTAALRVARSLLSHKLRLISEICLKEYPNEEHFVLLERDVKRLLAGALGLRGQTFEMGANAAILIVVDDIAMKARNVAEIFLHGRSLERYRRADRDYAADQYRPEKFLVDGLNLQHGYLRSLGCDIMLWATDYFKLGVEDEQTRQCIELISEDDELTADIGGNLKQEAILYFLNHLGILERRVN
jgi:hypothetical protein